MAKAKTAERKQAEADWATDRDEARAKADAATEAQLDYLESFGLRPDHHITKGEASALLSRAEEDGLPQINIVPKPTAFAKAKVQARKDISALKKKVSSQKIEKNIQKIEETLRSTALTKDEIEELQDQLEELKGDQEDLKSELEETQCELEALAEDEQFEKEALEERIDSHLFDFGRAGQYNPYFKKPTKKQMRAVLEALDAQFPNWEEKGEEPILATLQSSFPELVKKPLPSQQKSGCFGVFLIAAALPILSAGMLILSRIM